MANDRTNRRAGCGCRRSRRELPAGVTRREALRMGFGGLGVSAALPLLLHRTSSAMAQPALLGEEGGTGRGVDSGELGELGDRILVVVELSGGNDGLNTVVPFRNDEYYRVRPNLGIKRTDLIEVDEEFGFHPSLVGFERLFKEGQLGVVHGCGYDNPSLSHFESMGFWHTGVPNAGEALGWVGRFADLAVGEPAQELIVNVGASQSPAVRSATHTPVVFDDPNRFHWEGTRQQQQVYEKLSSGTETGTETGKESGHDRGLDSLGRHATNPALDFLNRVASSAVSSSKFVRAAAAGYRTPIDYGPGGGLGSDLVRVAALIDAGMPTNLYYVAASGNTFDTHVHQPDMHARLLMYASDALSGFMKDLERIGRSQDVAILVFTEFGRRVEENASLGTDHGTATPLFVIGDGVKGGFWGTPPSLTELDDGNLIKTTDFRRVYASMVEEWMGFGETERLLRGRFEPLGLFEASGAG